MDIFNVISLLGGLALFLYGMRLMGDNLKKNSSGTMQKVLGKVTNNAFTAFLLGVLVTALIQSSTATIVIIAGLVAAGMLDLKQSVGIIFGANVGTTVTGQIIRLLDLNTSGSGRWLTLFKPVTLAPLAALLGIILIMFINKRGLETVGQISMGFGILFIGLLNMSSAVEPLSQSETFVELFKRFAGQPFLGFLCGLIVASIVQSASASVGMLQTLSTTGVLCFSSIYPIIIGIYVGDALTTAIVCSIGTRTDAKRTGLITLLFNVFSIAFLMIGVEILHKVGVLNNIWNMTMSSGSIANTNTLFKLSSALVCVPASGLFYRTSVALIPEKSSGENIILDAALQKLDNKLFLSPKLALSSVHSVISVMQRLATGNAIKAMGLLKNYDQSVADEINRSEELIDRMADAVDDYLIRFSSHTYTEQDSDMINYYLQCYAEIERIGDLAVNIAENADDLRKQQSVLSAKANIELDALTEALSEILEDVNLCIGEHDQETAALIEPLEEVIDDMVAEVKKRHIKRLREGSCTSYTGLIFEDALINIERISDQCSNIAIYCIGLKNLAIMHNRHEYIQKLHEGGNASYNDEYTAKKTLYMNKLSAKA